MHIRNFNIILMLIAGTIVAIIGVISQYSLERLMYTMLGVLLVFYVLGTIIQGVINSISESAIEKERHIEISELEEEVNSLEEDNEKKMTESKS